MIEQNEFYEKVRKLAGQGYSLRKISVMMNVDVPWQEFIEAYNAGINAKQVVEQTADAEQPTSTPIQDVNRPASS